MAAATNGVHDPSLDTESDEDEMQQSEQRVNTDPINILILGETGVGKSTFINSLVNYLTFTTFEAAEENDRLISLIPCAFTISDPEGNLTKIVTGESETECFEDGQCATQATTIYRFQKDEFNLHLIDTPGVGDMRGVEKDQEHFEEMMQKLKQLDKLHAILILLKPNESKLNLMFRFCIQELLSHLHKSAINNILFAFTNSRCTFYMPGDTLPALEKLLDSSSEHFVPIAKDNVFCFDSESYRYLSATKQLVMFSDEIRQANMESWNHSSDEAMRLLINISNLKPHQVTETTSLDKTCKLVRALVKPVTEISRMIHLNMSILKCEIESVKSSSRKQILDRFKSPHVTFETRRLSKGRVVCTHADCVRMKDQGGVYKVVVYSTICHDGCDELEGERDYSLSSHDISKCVMMGRDGSSCMSCSHPPSDHAFMRYETVACPGKDLQPKVSDNISKKNLQQVMVDKRESQIKELKKEKDDLEKIVIKLGFFLKKNAIIASNDTWIEYLSSVIQQEERKAKLTGDDTVVQGLLLERGYYKMEIQQMDDMSGSDDEELDADQIQDLVRKVLDMKTTGPIIRDVLKRDPDFEPMIHP